MKRFLIFSLAILSPIAAVANTCPVAAPTGCNCPTGVTAVRVGSCNAGEITVVQGNCTGCNFAAGGGNLMFGI